MISILNIGAGKIEPLHLESYTNYFLVNLDSVYTSSSSIEEIEKSFDKWSSGKVKLFCREDAFYFMQRCRIKFNKICLYRVLEHIKFTDILYFIYLLSTSLEKEGVLDIIVPDYKILSRMLLQEDPFNDPNFEKNNIIITTEMLNEPLEPHASIWTEERAKYFLEYEKRFEVISLSTPCSFDGRDIYLQVMAKKVIGV